MRWEDKPHRKDCYLCGQEMAGKQDYFQVKGRIVAHWKCWLDLPVCSQCGRGEKGELCRECYRHKFNKR